MPMPCLQKSNSFLSRLRIKVADPSITTIVVKSKEKNEPSKPLFPKVMRDEIRLNVAL